MGNSRARLVLVVALTIAALTTFGSAPANATSGPSAAAVEVRATTLVAGHPNPLGVHLSLMPRAKLTETASGAPLAGQLVRFYMIPKVDLPVPNLPVCYAYTDAAGVAKCGSVGVLRDLFWSGARYRAEFSGADVGDVHYEASEDIVRLLGPQ